MGTLSSNECGDVEKKSKSDEDGDKIINRNNAEESKLLPKYDIIPHELVQRRIQHYFS